MNLSRAGVVQWQSVNFVRKSNLPGKKSILPRSRGIASAAALRRVRCEAAPLFMREQHELAETCAKLLLVIEKPGTANELNIPRFLSAFEKPSTGIVPRRWTALSFWIETDLVVVPLP
jgi:hypothetical protein